MSSLLGKYRPIGLPPLSSAPSSDPLVDDILSRYTAKPAPGPSFLDRAGSVLHGVGEVVGAPFRGLGMLTDLARSGGLEGSDIRLAGDGDVLSDLYDPRTTAPNLGQIATENIQGLTQAAAGYNDQPLSLRDLAFAPKPIGNDALTRRGVEQANPNLARAEAVAEPLAELGVQFEADPAIGLLGPLGASGKRGQLAERLLGASFVPGMGQAAYQQGKEFLRQGEEQGYTSPDALRAGVGSLTSGAMAALGATHALPSLERPKPSAGAEAPPLGAAEGVGRGIPPSPASPPGPPGTEALQAGMDAARMQAQAPPPLPEQLSPLEAPSAPQEPVRPSIDQRLADLSRPSNQDLIEKQAALLEGQDIGDNPLIPPEVRQALEARRGTPPEPSAPAEAPPVVPEPVEAVANVHPAVARKLDELRRQVAGERPHLTPEDVEALATARSEKFLHRLTGLPERELFDQAAKEGRFGGVASSDAREFGSFNKKFGHQTGDRTIKALGEKIQEALIDHPGVEVFHAGGDEFRLGGPDENAVRIAGKAIQERLAGAKLTYEAPDGTLHETALPEVDFGYGHDFKTADAELGAQKLARKARRAGESGAVPSEPAAGGQAEPDVSGRLDVPAESRSVRGPLAEPPNTKLPTIYQPEGSHYTSKHPEAVTGVVNERGASLIDKQLEAVKASGEGGSPLFGDKANLEIDGGDVPKFNDFDPMERTGTDKFAVTPEPGAKVLPDSGAIAEATSVEANKPGSGPESLPDKEALRARVEKVFPKLKIEEQAGGFVLPTPSGKRILIKPTGEVTFNAEAVARHGAKAAEALKEGKARIAGATSSLGPDVLVQIADKGILPHESMHVFLDHFAKPDERALIQKHFEQNSKGKAWDEAAADAYNKWFDKPQEVRSTVLQKFFGAIKDFASKVRQVFSPTAEGVFGKVKSGEVFEREGTKTETAPKFAIKPIPDKKVEPPKVDEIPPKPTLGSKAYEFWINGLLSGPKTHLANATGNTLTQLLRIPEKAIAGVLSRERFVGEALADVGAIKEGVKRAVHIFKDRAFNEQTDTSGKIEYGPKIEGKAGRIVRLPSRLLGASDEAFKAVASTREARSQAYRKARQEGLSGQKLADRVEDIVANLDKHPEIVDKIHAEAEYQTFTKQLGAFGQALTGLREKDPSGLTKVIVPFMKTPMNVAKYTLERTPLNFARILKLYAQKRLQGGELADELAKPILGTLIGTGFALAAHEGYLTGGGPGDEKKKATLKATGWQPYSLKLGKDYYSFSRLEPFASIAGFAADLVESKDETQQRDLVNKIVGSVGENLTNKTFLQGVENFFLMWSDPQRYASQYAKNLEGSIVPALVANFANATDETVRKTSPLDASAIGARLPGISHLIEPARRGTGEEITRDNNVFNAISPVQRSTEKGSERDLERVFVSTDFTPSGPPRTLSVRGTKVELSEKEYEFLRKKDEAATKYLRTVAPRLKTMNADSARRYLRGVYERYGDEGAKAIRQSPDFRKRLARAIKGGVTGAN